MTRNSTLTEVEADSPESPRGSGGRRWFRTTLIVLAACAVCLVGVVMLVAVRSDHRVASKPGVPTTFQPPIGPDHAHSDDRLVVPRGTPKQLAYEDLKPGTRACLVSYGGVTANQDELITSYPYLNQFGDNVDLYATGRGETYQYPLWNIGLDPLSNAHAPMYKLLAGRCGK